MSQAITVSFKLTENELSAVIRNQVQRRAFKSCTNQIIIGWITLVVIAVDLISLIGALTDRPFTGISPIFLVLLTLAVAAFWLFYFFPTFLLRRNVDDKFFDQQIWQFIDSGIRLELPHASLKYDYSHFQRVEEDGQFYILYVTPYSSTPVPKRAFETRAEQDQFRALIKSRLPNSLK